MKHRSLAIRLVFSCLLCSSSTSASDSVCAGQPIGSLRPSDIPPAPVFSSWESNYTVDLPTGVSVAVAEGVLNGPGGRPARFAVLPGVVQRDEVAAILELVNSSTTPTFDADPDSVDGLPTHEFFVEDVHKELHTNGQIKIDSDPRLLAHRRPLREALKTRIHAFLRERVTPLVHARYPEACVGAPGRTCRPCYMLVRRYLPEERRSHGSHHDGHALVTVVVSLTDHGSEYEGGLYVGAGHGGGGRRVVGLSRGDAVMHQSDLLHGVKVESGERWSLIIWYRDSSTCEEHGLDWFKQCAEEGDPTCQHMYSTKVGPVPGSADPAAGRLRWAKLAAEGGSPVAMIKLGRAYLKRLPSSLKLDFTAAAKWFRRAAEASGEPDAHYALAQMMLDGQLQPPGGEGGGGAEAVLAAAVRQFEEAAAGHHVFAAYNLGVAHLYGYGVQRDPDRAAEWFEASGLPEGFFVVSLYHGAAGDVAEKERWEEHAKRLGFGAPWRKMAREQTGSGGSGGVDMHSNWPERPGSPVPPRW